MCTSVVIDGKTVKIGDTVGFKSDYEQSGKVSKIERHPLGAGYILTLTSEDGFGGEYLRGATVTKVSARDCWVD